MTKRQRVVVIEDDADIRELITYNLEREGYQVEHYGDGLAGLAAVTGYPPDLVVLDIMLPGLDGHEICRAIRAQSGVATVPILMVTAKADETDIVLGLGLGADDYLPKPFRPRELVARVKARLRRHGGMVTAAPEGVVAYGGLAIDPDRRRVSVDGVEVELTATEFRLLHFLATHPEIAYTRADLVQAAVGDEVIVVERNIDVHIRRIRQKLGSYERLLVTHRGHGYSLDPRKADRA